mgnify:FL=1
MTDIIQNLKDVISSIKTKSLNYAELDVLLKNLQKLKDTQLAEILETLDNKIGETNALHDSKEINYLQDKFSNVKSNTWWNNSNTDVQFSPILEKYINTYVDSVVDWRLPACEIGYGHGHYSLQMVLGYNPIYLLDLQKYYNQCYGTWNSKNKNATQKNLDNRIFWITVDKNCDITKHQVPYNQMGYVQCINVFQYLTPDNMKAYLKSIYKILRPGGTAIITYTDATVPAQFKLVGEKGYRFFTKNRMKHLIDRAGFEVKSWDEPTSKVSAVILQKPGTIKSILRAISTVNYDIDKRR